MKEANPLARRASGATTPSGVTGAVEAVIAHLAASRGLRSTTLANRVARMRLFASFAQTQGVRELDDVSTQQVATFVDSRRQSGVSPALSERHSRRAAIRLLYREARHLGLASSDPALDCELPPRNPTSARPLTDEEIELGRSYSVRTSDTRPAVCWALGEATSWTSEMPHARLSALALEEGTVFIHGGATTDPRVARLTPWGLTQMKRRLRMIDKGEGSDPILMGEGRWDHPDEGRAAATMALVATLKAARLSAPGVNPRSIAAWAGAKALAEGASIDLVARMLGVRSLDQAAKLIGFRWRQEAP